MTAKELIRLNLNRSRFLTKTLLGDLSDADLKVRYVPGANTIAWQLGHLIVSEHNLLEAARKGAAAPLPDGFAKDYSKESSDKDDLKVLPKEEYLRLYDEQRAATLRLLDTISDNDLDQPTPESYRSWLANIGDLLQMLGEHETMHSGQITAVRRKLGKPHAF